MKICFKYVSAWSKRSAEIGRKNEQLIVNLGQIIMTLDVLAYVLVLQAEL